MTFDGLHYKRSTIAPHALGGGPVDNPALFAKLTIPNEHHLSSH